MRKRVQGSYTVEAALIFPMIMGIIVFIIYMSFYLHDMSVMKSCAYQAALKASLIRSSEADMQTEAQKAAEYNISGLLLATQDLKTETRISGREVSVTYSGTLRIPQGLLFMHIIGTDNIQITQTGKAFQKDAIEFIRTCRAAEHLAGSVTTP